MAHKCARALSVFFPFFSIFHFPFFYFFLEKCIAISHQESITHHDHILNPESSKRCFAECLNSSFQCNMQRLEKPLQKKKTCVLPIVPTQTDMSPMFSTIHRNRCQILPCAVLFFVRGFRSLQIVQRQRRQEIAYLLHLCKMVQYKVRYARF